MLHASGLTSMRTTNVYATTTIIDFLNLPIDVTCTRSQIDNEDKSLRDDDDHRFFDFAYREGTVSFVDGIMDIDDEHEIRTNGAKYGQQTGIAYDVATYRKCEV